MATRQYVGARYVPKFYQNTQNPDSSEWEANQTYEALTIVTYNNGSYTSKIPVPAGIGNPVQNPTYWVNTGNYNAQVEQYRQETQDVQASTNKAIELTRDGIFLMFGDSWTVYNNNTLFRTCAQYFNNGSYLYGISGAKIEDLTKQIEEANNDTSFNNDDVGTIFIIAGTNNVYHLNLTSSQAIQNVFRMFKSTFKNADIHYFPNNSRTANGGRNQKYLAIIYGALTTGIHVHMESMMYPYTNNFSRYLGTDETGVQHLSEAGYIDFGNFIYSISKGNLANGAINCNFSATLLDQSDANCVVEANGNLYGSCRLTIKCTNVTPSSSYTIRLNTNSTGEGTCPFYLTPNISGGALGWVKVGPDYLTIYGYIPDYRTILITSTPTSGYTELTLHIYITNCLGISLT